MSSTAEALYASLSSEAALERMVAERREEDLYLEFKQKRDASTSELHDDDRRSFSKALSGFANADGGVLVFGVRTAKTQDGIDRAAELAAIHEPERVRARLMDSILNTTQPVVDHVRLESLLSASGKGYVKCLIPQSVKPPHKAMLADKRYWRRISSGYREMDHYELEDVFGRRLRPSLKIGFELRPRPDSDPHEDLHLFLINEGRGVAKHARVLCVLEDAKLAGVSGGLNESTQINGGRPTFGFYDPRSVIHANGIARALGFAIVLRETKGTTLNLDVVLNTEDMETVRYSLCVTPGPMEFVRPS
jgi:Putative DNA-binding domain